MYEFDKSYFEQIVHAICDIKVITEINKYITNKTTGMLSVCFPTNKSEENTFYFAIEGDKNIGLSELAKILSIIKHNINYDDTLDHQYIMVINKEAAKEGTFPKSYKDNINYTPNNHNKILQFFADHYSHRSPELKAFFEKMQITNKGKEVGNEIKEEVSPDALYNYLKKDEKLYDSLKRSPERLNEIIQPVIKRLREDQQASNASLSSVNRIIPVK